MKKIFVTGIQGFVGSAIRSALAGDERFRGFELVAEDDPLELLDADLVARTIAGASPDYVIHLAAQSFVPAAFANPQETLSINFFGTLNLLQALKTAGFRGRFLYISSGDVYGLVAPEHLPISETQPIRPRNPYAVSKAAAEALCYQWSQTEDFEVVIARPFNHIGPGQNERFVVSDFCRQVVAIRRGVHAPVIDVGDIAVTRDFTDVRDVVAAYFSLLEAGGNGETYNVCSGREYLISNVLERILAISGIHAEPRQDSTRLRRAEQRRIAGSYTKLNTATGWQPALDLDKSLQDSIAYWEQRTI